MKANSDATVWVHELDAEPGPRRLPPFFRLYLRPTAWPLLAHGLRNRLLATPDTAEIRTFTDGEILDVPAQTRVRHLPGHTRGNCALHLPDASVVFSGDTGHVRPVPAASRAAAARQGVNEDNEQARASLEQLAGLNARVLLPGHGEPWRDGVAAAVAEARRHGYW